MIRNRINLTRPVNWRHPLNVGRVAWWLSLPQWGFGGNTWHDLCRRNNGTLTNGPTWRATARPGGWGAMNCDGTDDYAAITSIAGLEQVSLAAWVQTTASGQLAIMDRDFGTRYWQFRKDSGGNFRFIAFNSGGTPGQAVTTGINLADGNWHRVIGTWDGTTVRTYVDGVANGTAVLSGNLPTVALDFGIGFTTPATTGSSFWSGQIDDASIWNRALSASEVALDYDFSRHGYPGVLNRVRTLTYSDSSQPPPPSGGLVCATVGLAARVDATANVAPRVDATVSLSPRVNATADVQEC